MSSSPLLIFDLGSTLVGGPAHGPARQLATLVGLDASEKYVVHRLLMTQDFEGPEHAAMTVREHLASDITGLEEAVGHVWAAQRKAAYLLPRVRETLDVLAGGHRLAILSNIWTPFLAAAEDALDGFLDRHVPSELRVFSCRSGIMKPDRELFSGLLQRAGIAPGDAVMIGDSYDKDIAPALALGMRAIWVAQESSASTTGPEAIVPSVARLVAMGFGAAGSIPGGAGTPSVQ